MNALYFIRDTMTIKQKDSKAILFSYNPKQDALSVDLLDYSDSKVILLLYLCTKYNVTRIYLDYNSELYEVLSSIEDIEVSYSLPYRNLY